MSQASQNSVPASAKKQSLGSTLSDNELLYRHYYKQLAEDTRTLVQNMTAAGCDKKHVECVLLLSAEHYEIESALHKALGEHGIAAKLHEASQGIVDAIPEDPE